jgi:hypothetical protein
MSNTTNESSCTSAKDTSVVNTIIDLFNGFAKRRFHPNRALSLGNERFADFLQSKSIHMGKNMILIVGRVLGFLAHGADIMIQLQWSCHDIFIFL